jgi:tetratricopeptide (TPR) repeat protein
MRRKVLHPLILGILWLTIPSFMNAQMTGMGGHRPAFEIDVQIRYANGQPGPRGIHVRLESAEGGAEADCETIDGGTCQFKPAYPGAYTVRMSEPNYKEASARVDLVGTTRGSVTFELKPLQPEDASDKSTNSISSESISVDSLRVPENIRKEYQKGEAALTAQNPAEAARHFEKATKLSPTFPQGYWKLGEAYLEEKEWKKAEVALKKSIELEPKLGAAYVDLGAVYNQMQNYAAAEQALKKGLELGTDDAVAKYELAKAYWSMGRWQDAMPLAQDAVSAMPKLAAAHVLLGNIDLKKRDASGALREYEEYLRLEPEGPMAPEVRKMVTKLRDGLAK